MILPLRLEWEPFYALPEDCPDLAVGDRVSVPFAGRVYLGVVSAIGVTPPDGAAAREKEIYGPRKDKAHILPTELEFWRLVAGYYLCSVGEVYKAAYPSVKDETVSPRRKEKPFVPIAQLPPDESKLHKEAAAALSGGKPVVLSCRDEVAALLSLCRDEALCGTSVLWLVPELKFGKALEKRLRDSLGSRLLVWGSDITPARKREVARILRSGQPYVVLGTRSALFLPHRSLGMVIIQDEFDPSYKQTSPAPRLNARDAAILLSSVFGARTVLSAYVPSLETQLNCFSGKYLAVTDHPCAGTRLFDIVDTRAELRKNGMVGELSRKLLAAVESAGASATVFYKPRRAAFPKMEDLASGVQAAFPGGGHEGVGGALPHLTDDLVGNPPPRGVGLLAIFGIDALLGRPDFRADERAYQLVSQAVALCGDGLGHIIIQTREPAHPVFAALSEGNVAAMLDERRRFGLPPFTRLVDILIQDNFPDRALRMSSSLAAEIVRQGIGRAIALPDRVRVTLERDSQLRAAKARLLETTESFAKESHYQGHFAIDVDPQV